MTHAQQADNNLSQLTPFIALLSIPVVNRFPLSPWPFSLSSFPFPISTWQWILANSMLCSTAFGWCDYARLHRAVSGYLLICRLLALRYCSSMGFKLHCDWFGLFYSTWMTTTQTLCWCLLAVLKIISGREDVALYKPSSVRDAWCALGIVSSFATDQLWMARSGA